MFNLRNFLKKPYYPFNLITYTKSSTAERLGIKNLPEVKEIECLIHLHNNIIFPVAWKFRKENLKINSVYRCVELNRALKSKDTSQHIKGQAVDFEIIGLDNKKFYSWCKKTLNYDQLILEFYRDGDPSSGWIHCSYVSNDVNRKQDFTIGG